MHENPPELSPPPQPSEPSTPSGTAPPPATDPSYGIQVMIGFATFFGLVISLVLVASALTSENVLIILPACIPLILLGVFSVRRRRRRGFLIGALIGLGVLALLAGLCAVMVLSSIGSAR